MYSNNENKTYMSKSTTDTIFKDCPIRNVLSHICGKWSMLVMYTIHNNNNIRFNALGKSIPDISQKMLTSTLRSLETDGFVIRHVYAEVPPRVEYSLTKRAESFIPLVEELIGWAKNNMADIMKDREKNTRI